MSGQILTAEPSRVTRFFETDTGYGIQTITDVTRDVELAQALHNEGYHHSRGGDEHLARIPVAVLNAWAIKRGVTFDAVMQDSRLMDEFLNDPDHGVFRIKKGRV